ncbi:hypothetical protein Dtox_0014 [Desulfofarcimen acetoxidans DSM 771]|uniref:Uncharacterized protein n=1 Tax=Desulfofarcimen acetoxidans (strain ATCC 49208 / DSM 771 / KCTC 5769 / VKM B-1644 / 5575) TaxID=485916 RepID=C8VVA9_DESAS|nr:hypothetical protein [Desulfofarcimen acetoxidans]ACV60978.1 hypothetical protein Dtox_0014 [Desulfofarcimen acetoxidans DSM 771]
MDIKKYSEEVIDLLNNLSDEEFDMLLIDAGIVEVDECPFVMDTSLKISLSMSVSYKEAAGIYSHSITDANKNNFVVDLKVA